MKMFVIHAPKHSLNPTGEISIRSNLKLGLPIDQPKAGFGSTNDGNTWRRITASKITGVDFEIIKHFGTLANVLNCQLKININRLRSYCKETAKMFVDKNKW